MSCKKDRLNHRKYQYHRHTWGCGSAFRRDRNRGLRARNKQRMREGRYELLWPFVHDALYHYW